MVDDTGLEFQSSRFSYSYFVPKYPIFKVSIPPEIEHLDRAN